MPRPQKTSWITGITTSVSAMISESSTIGCNGGLQRSAALGSFSLLFEFSDSRLQIGERGAVFGDGSAVFVEA